MTDTGVVRVDAHHHAWDLSVRPQPWTDDLPELRRSFPMQELTPLLRRHAIDRTVVVQTVCVPAETPELLALAAGDDRVAGVVGWVDLTAAGVAAVIQGLRAGVGGQSLVGVRHQVQQEPDRRWLCRPDVRRGLAAVAAAGLVYDLLVTEDQLIAATQTVEELPQLAFVLDHAGKPDVRSGRTEPWATAMAELARHTNITVKLSGLVTEADHDSWTVADLRPYVDVLLEAFGPERIMFGSDWPVCLLAADYDRVVGAAEELLAELTSDERAAIFGGTARRVYDLDMR